MTDSREPAAGVTTGSAGVVPTIGILAGMGPRSTSPFLERVLDECARQYGARLDADFPPILVLSQPTPFTLDGPLDPDAMTRAIRAGLLRLVDAGADLVAIPCNVAHLWFEAIVHGLDVPVLHLVETAIGALPDDVRTATVLATRPVVDAGLYQAALEARDAEVRDPGRYREAVDDLIGGVKASNPAERLDEAWDALVDDLVTDGVDAVVLGSTDLAAVPATAREARVRVVESGGAAAAELVRRWRALAGR